MNTSSLRRVSRTFVPLCLSVAMVFSAAAEPLKVATVNMTTLLNQYYKTKAAEEEEKLQTENIKKKDAQRQSAITAIVEELQKLQKEFSDPSLSPEKKKSIAQTANDRQATLAGLQKERQEFLDRNRRALTQKMGGLMNEIRNAVIEGVNAHAATLDVDYVLDESGLTTNQVPFLVYIRNKTDITQDVLQKLNKDAPAPPGDNPAAPE
jgi:outer membrane protein